MSLLVNELKNKSRGFLEEESKSMKKECPMHFLLKTRKGKEEEDMNDLS